MLWSCRATSSSDSALQHASSPQNQQQPAAKPSAHPAASSPPPASSASPSPPSANPASPSLPPGYLSAADATAHHALAEEGGASWYGGGKIKKGKRTASGHKFNPEDYTAAHRFLPFGTMVRVFNLSNNKSVDVRINDRGPHIEDRIIDLSRQAAKKLEMLSDGVIQVRLETLNCTLDADGAPAGEFWVQVNALFNEKEFSRLQARVRKTKKELKVKNTAKSKKQKSRLLIGPYVKLNDALKVAAEMHQRYDSAFIIAN